MDKLRERLDEILGRHFPSGELDPVTLELRELLASAQIEEYVRHQHWPGGFDPKAHNDYIREIYKRWGIVPDVMTETGS